MLPTSVYMDNHATTRLDPRVLEVMLPCFQEHYGNPASASHPFGWDAKEAVDAARATIPSRSGLVLERSYSPAVPRKAIILPSEV